MAQRVKKGFERVGITRQPGVNQNETGARFDIKQERLMEYTAEYYDYREARASEFLNFLAAILTGAALAELIATLIPNVINPGNPVLYLGVYGVCIALVLAIMIFLLRRV